jgi:hypothetical protein
VNIEIQGSGFSAKFGGDLIVENYFTNHMQERRLDSDILKP